MFSKHHSDTSAGMQKTGFFADISRVLNTPALGIKSKYALTLVAIPFIAAVSFMALSQSSPPSIPAIALSSDPLYAATTGDKPALALALSVEFPTVGAQYVDPDNNNSGTSDDVTYSPTIEYLGYYDAESCYTYDDAGTGAPSGQASNYKRYVRRGSAIPLSTLNTANPTWTSRLCWDGSKSYSKDDGTTPAYSTTSNDAFSGNFLNWASSSAIDMLRLSLTGGDRVIDTPTLTVLQRAVIPDGDPINMGNSSNFPSKRLYRSGTSRAITSTNFASASFTSGVLYFGAVPSAMASAAGNDDILVANTLNRIYFGIGPNKSGNNSGSFGAYTLGSTGSSAHQIGPIAGSSATLPGTGAYQKGTTSTSSTALQGALGYQLNTITNSTASVPEGTQFGSIQSASSRPGSTTQCAKQNDICALPAGTYEVWYGQGSSYQYAVATGDVACSNARFGLSSGTGNKCYSQAYAGTSPLPSSSTFCANKDGTCTLPSGTWEVWYGNNGAWKVAAATDAPPCTNAVFGNPGGSGQKCYYKPYNGSWTPAPAPTFCANNIGTCTLPSGNWEVWYGNGSTWKYGPATGAVPCTTSVWTSPGSGTNSCFYLPYSGTWTPPASVTACASENGTCTLPPGVREVWYGAGNSWKIAPATGLVPCTNAVFGDPAPGVGKNCYYGSYSGTWTPTTPTTTALNSDGYFFARVQVCDRDASTYTLKDKRYWSLCTQYSDGDPTPHASYKPTGAIQKYSDQLRLAAFGYLMDQNTSRYGGVLRAPIKYVGSKTYDVSGNVVSGGNPNQEWNATTGVFTDNPDGNNTVQTTDGRGVYLSGVIGYVNQFGRTGAVAGRYKKYDPLGELHYQALRYLQGLAPSPDAISGLPGTPSLYDGYPAYTSWTDPYGGGRTNTKDYSCLKSNIVVIGDINTWDYNSRLPTASDANNIPNISYWDSITANFESKTSSTYVDGQGVTQSISNPNTANTSGLSSASGSSNLVGSAYWAHTHDIRGSNWTNATAAGTAGTTLQRPGLRVKTFAFDVNEYGGSNVSTTRRSSNQLFRAAKYGGFEADPSNAAKNPYNTKGNPFVNEKDGANNNDVWMDTDTRASRAGEANTYFLQSDARGVLSAFDDIFSRASTTSYNIGGGANDSRQRPPTHGNNIYQGKFDTSDWSGDLEARLTTTNALVWSAADRLGVMNSPATSRNIVVGKVGATANPVATQFAWGAIESSLQTALNASDGLGQDRLNYLRGDKSKEGSPFRQRTKLLGDIINSGVSFSGKPSTDISLSTYASFATTNASRAPAVFVGANDGMLHAFHANTGDELFAFIPSWLGPKLPALTNAAYGTNTTPHQSYVDGTPAVAEAQVGSAGTAADWKTVLVGGTGGGGQGVYALDVTDPTNFTASNAMWEFTHADDQDLGNVTGRPQILKLRTNAYNATSPTYKWFAVVASGVNNYVSDSAGLFSSTGNPALFLLDISKAAGAPWSLGSNYYKIPLPVDSTLSTSKATGLVNFTAELGPAGDVALIYMGDLHGKLWKLDFSLSLGSTEWNINKLSSFNKGTSTSPDPYPLFIAQDGSGNAQPITAAPLVAPGNARDTRFIYFGTGKYYELSDKASTATQTAYMVFDNGTNSGDALTSGATRASAISGRLRLKQGTANSTTGVISTPAFTPGRAATVVNTEVIRSGWYADLPNSGERQISDAFLVRLSNKLLFNSLIPGATGSSGCAAALDGGRTYSIDIATGNGTSKDSTVGLLGEVMAIERPDLTEKTISDNTGKRIKILTSDVYQLGSQGWKKVDAITTAVTAGRLSWRQINNYQDMKN